MVPDQWWRTQLPPVKRDPFDEGVRAGAIGTTIAIVILGLCAVGIWTIAHGVWP
jgi:hypothetical protein